MKGLLCSFTANNHSIPTWQKIKVTGCWYKKTRVCSHIVIVHIHAPFFWGGGPKSILFPLFQTKKTSFKGIYMLNDKHICESFSVQKV